MRDTQGFYILHEEKKVHRHEDNPDESRLQAGKIILESVQHTNPGKGQQPNIARLLVARNEDATIPSARQKGSTKLRRCLGRVRIYAKTTKL